MDELWHWLGKYCIYLLTRCWCVGQGLFPAGHQPLVASAEAGFGLSQVPVCTLPRKHSSSPYTGFHVTWPTNSARSRQLWKTRRQSTSVNQRLSVKWAGVHVDGKGDEHSDWTTADLIWPLIRALEQVGALETLKCLTPSMHKGHSAPPLLARDE